MFVMPAFCVGTLEAGSVFLRILICGHGMTPVMMIVIHKSFCFLFNESGPASNYQCLR
jgi:hypothetical protein